PWGTSKSSVPWARLSSRSNRWTKSRPCSAPDRDRPLLPPRRAARAVADDRAEGSRVDYLLFHQQVAQRLHERPVLTQDGRRLLPRLLQDVADAPVEDLALGRRQVRLPRPA